MPNTHRPSLVWLHWLMLLMIAMVYISMECREVFDKGTLGRMIMLSIHYLLGLLIMVLALFRLLMWLRAAKIQTPDYGVFQKISAKMMFFALYALMIVMPLLGWASLDAYGVKITIVGSILPILFEPNEVLAHQISDIHTTFGNVGYFLIVCHAIAALFHHFVKRDDTLKRMLKFRS